MAYVIIAHVSGASGFFGVQNNLPLCQEEEETWRDEVEVGQEEEEEEVEGKGGEDVMVLEGRGICILPAWTILSKILPLIILMRAKDLSYQMGR